MQSMLNGCERDRVTFKCNHGKIVYMHSGMFKTLSHYGKSKLSFETTASESGDQTTITVDCSDAVMRFVVGVCYGFPIDDDIGRDEIKEALRVADFFQMPRVVRCLAEFVRDSPIDVVGWDTILCAIETLARYGNDDAFLETLKDQLIQIVALNFSTFVEAKVECQPDVFISVLKSRDLVISSVSEYNVFIDALNRIADYKQPDYVLELFQSVNVQSFSDKQREVLAKTLTNFVDKKMIDGAKALQIATKLVLRPPERLYAQHYINVNFAIPLAQLHIRWKQFYDKEAKSADVHYDMTSPTMYTLCKRLDFQFKLEVREKTAGIFFMLRRTNDFGVALELKVTCKAGIVVPPRQFRQVMLANKTNGYGFADLLTEEAATALSNKNVTEVQVHVHGVANRIMQQIYE